MSTLVSTACPQLQPGSIMCAPSEVMSRAAVRCPLAEKLPIGPDPVPWISPVKAAAFVAPAAIAIPGRILMNSAALLPRTATLWSCFSVITCDFSPESIGVRSPTPVTSTVWDTLPTTSAMLLRLRLSPESRVMPFDSHFSKPWASIVTVYVPGWMADIVKNPAALLTVRRVSPLRSLFSVTVAFGTTAWLASATVPVNAAVAPCANACGTKQSKQTAASSPNASFRAKGFLDMKLAPHHPDSRYPRLDLYTLNPSGFPLSRTHFGHYLEA